MEMEGAAGGRPEAEGRFPPPQEAFLRPAGGHRGTEAGREAEKESEYKRWGWSPECESGARSYSQRQPEPFPVLPAFP